ncbi:MAG: PilZ domain-containing protein [Magnetococcales bacterium]|nr:PilZ domain-containing protein [Magnetococcales bacterium]
MIVQPMATSRAQRIDFSTRVLLEFGKEKGFVGNTENISESGAFVVIGYPPIQVTIGDPGLLHLMPIGNRQPSFFKISRITDHGIAVHFLRDCPPWFKTTLALKDRIINGSVRTFSSQGGRSSYTDSAHVFSGGMDNVIT